MSSNKKETKDAIVGIDLGTSRSGFAFAFPKSGNEEQKVICGEVGSSLGAKVPSVLLLQNNATMDLLGFGDDAEAKFKEADAEGKLNDVLYISGFKLELYQLNASTDLKTLTLRPINNNQIQVPLELILQRCFEAISQDAVKRLLQIQKTLKPERISWVLLTPAIWSQSAIEFMRGAAEKAGIPGANITFALEPEAAAIQCRQALKRKPRALPAAAAPSSNFGSGGAPTLMTLPPAAKPCFLVADLGGGTVDFTIHEVVDDTYDEVIEKCPASGGIWGSTIVNACFLEFLKRLVGPKVLESFRLQHPVAYLDLIKAFETIKDRIDPNRTSASGYSSIRLPGPLMDLFKEIVKALPHTVTGPLGVEIPFGKSQDMLSTRDLWSIANRYPTVDLASSIQMQSERQSHQLNVEHLIKPTTPVPAPSSFLPFTEAVPPMQDRKDLKDGKDTKETPQQPCTIVMSEAILTAPDVHEEAQAPLSDTWFKGDLLKIHNDTMKHFFHASVNMIADYIERKCETYKDRLQTVFLVGGYASSPMVQSAVDKVVKKFPTIFLSTPPHPGECVLTGAVLYGLRPEQIRGRIASHHYLVSAMSKWDETIHGKSPLAKKTLLQLWKGSTKLIPYCANHAFLICPKLQLIPNDHKGFSHNLYVPADRKDNSTVQLVFGRSSADVAPLIFDDPSVTIIGKIYLRCDTKATHQQKLLLQMFLGDRELRVMAENETAKEIVHATISALDKPEPVCRLLVT